MTTFAFQNGEGWPMIVTAANVTAQHMNTLLLRSRYFGDEGDPSAESPWGVLRDSRMNYTTLLPTQIPVYEGLLDHNDFSGWSLSGIDAWLCRPDIEAKIKAAGMIKHNAAVVDAKGLETGTVVVIDTWELRNNEEEPVDKYAAVRVPFEDAPWIMCNLAIANMDIIEWMDEDVEPDEEGVRDMTCSIGPQPKKNEAECGDLGRELEQKGLLAPLPHKEL